MMRGEPCNPEQLFRYAFGDPTDDVRAAVASHVAECDSCRIELTTIQRVAAGSESSPAEQSDALPDIARRMRRIAERDDAAKRRAEADVRRVLAQPSSLQVSTLYAHSIEASPALVWRLMDEADQLLFTEPRLALPLYDLATHVADTAAGQGILLSHELRVEAWKNYAWALAFMGEYAKAEDAIFWAEDAANQCADRRHMTAIVNLTRGIQLTQMERWSEALPIVVAARQTFAELGDEPRKIKALEQEANIHVRLGNAAVAVAIHSSIVDLPGDDMTRARRYGNMALSFEAAGALWKASEMLARAKEIHAQLGMSLLLFRDTWALARILSRMRRLDEACAKFAEASAGLRSLDAGDDAIRVDLDWSEVEIEHGSATDATYSRLRAAATYSIEKGLPVAKCRALAYLQQLGRTATVTHVRFVRSFIEMFDSNPHMQFQPPERLS